MNSFAVRFEAPVTIDLYLPDQQFPKPVCLYKCYKAIVEADKQPSDDARWVYLQEFIAKESGFTNQTLSELQIWEGTAREFRDVVIERMETYKSIIKKKLDLIASLPITTLDLQPSETPMEPLG